jgi:hypothetical protein
MKRRILQLFVAAAMSAALGDGAVADPLGTAFTYQGELRDAGGPVDGQDCDFEFSLWDALSNGTQMGLVLNATIYLEAGRFTVPLDFGEDVFAGEARWLEIAVCCPSPCAVVMLSPRQEVTPAPNAMFSKSTRGINVDPLENVGIGTAAPSAKLEVAGDVTVSGLGGSGSITIDGTTDTITASSGSLSFGSTNLVTTGSVNAAAVNGLAMGKVYLTATGTIVTTRGGGNVLRWNTAGTGSIELTNTSGDWCDFWWQAQKGAATSGGASAISSPSTNVVIISGMNSNDYGCEVHFGQADGQGGWASVWLQYANGVLVGHYIKY